MSGLNVGSIVRCRNREWIVLPSPTDEIVLLRPLTGGESEVCGIYRRLSNLGFDKIEPANFPLPKPEDAGDSVSAELLWNAARLSLRNGAGPFRSLGRISLRPRPYQFVPLLMALRLQPVRLLIADDVGVGKTIEALLIARELLDRGEIKRICVLCPPYLCDQWQSELWEKFHIEAVVIRSGTVSQLERGLSSGQSIFGYYPHLVVSIDYAKSKRHRNNFLLHCPELVIVDEAHGASQSSNQGRAQQQRHELLKMVAKDQSRHLILLTATPHSGVEESFLSLLGLLQPCFVKLNLSYLTEEERKNLALYFVQRRRKDVDKWLGEETPFPERASEERTFTLSPLYRQLFERVYEFSRELVCGGESFTVWKRKVRYWRAIALLRCVMSSPKTALIALSKRGKAFSVEGEPDEELYSSYIYDPTDKEVVDAQPTHVIQEFESELEESDKRHLREFAKLAQRILENNSDPKLIECTRIIRELLQEGYHPIVWCRYIATSDYVAEELSQRLENEFKDLRVVSITGALSEDERRVRIEELSHYQKRVLVSTDCLSEGINLQEHFNAVVHYDLPWNPNRLEQREGRVDRFGQRAKKVKAILLYGQDNPIDGAVLDVLLRKARNIHRTLGITVPVPADSETVMESVLRSLFLRGHEPKQLSLFDDPLVRDLHSRWDESENREKESRTRFAQKGIKPDEVDRELKETDSVLGDPKAVKNFVLNVCQRFGIAVKDLKDGIFELSSLDRFPEIINNNLHVKDNWKVTFTTPTPENVTYLGRNHPFVSSLAQYLLEEALTKGSKARASRCGVIRTGIVSRRTILLLLKLRFMVEEHNKRPMLAEEVLISGFSGFPRDGIEWLDEGKSLDLLQKVSPEANISQEERREILEEVLGLWNDLQCGLKSIIDKHAKKLEDAHRRVRSSANLSRRIKVEPYLPPDLLGILVLMPKPGGVGSWQQSSPV